MVSKIGNIVFDCADPRALSGFWSDVLGYPRSDYQAGKNRVHPDINATPGRRASPQEVDAEVERVVGLGATVQRKSDGAWGPYPEYHYVMADPEGNEFCIQ